jgi:carbon-monoxide dehydrogenase medium subunit
MRWETYKVARSLEEAFGCLEQFQGKARVIAGGTDLVVQLSERGADSGMVLLDISSISDMRGVKIADGGKEIMVGAATTMAELAQSEIIAKYGRALALGASCMGAPQIRNVATIGGNVVNAQPAADGTIPLLALGAEARVVSAKAEKWIALEELFLDVGRSLVNPSEEIITHFRFKPSAETGSSSLQRLAKRKAFTLPTLLVAAMVRLDGGKQFFEEVRIAVGPVARTPWLAREAADGLRGSPVSQEAIEKAGAAAKLAAHPRDSLRGGAEYRKEMVEVLTKRAILECVTSLGVNV